MSEPTRLVVGVGSAMDEDDSEFFFSIFGQVAFAAPAEILEPLWSPADAKTRFREFTRENARDFFVYKVLLDVQKVGSALLRWAEFLRDATEPENSVARIALHSRIAEHSLWQRRLVEMLALLIGFAETNEPAYFYHYLLLRETTELQHSQRDQDRYFGSRSHWVDRQVDIRRDQINAVVTEPGFAQDCCWYAQNGRPASMAQILAFALERATPMERRSLGYSYGVGYSGPSESIHFDPLSKSEPRLSTLQLASTQSVFLCCAVINRVQALMGIRRETEACQAARQAAEVPTRDGLRGHVAVGDFVAVLFKNEPYPAEVTAITTSRYGNDSYEVEFLLERPEGIAQDSLLPRYIAPRLPRAGMADEVRRILREHVAEEEVHRIEELSDHELHEALRKAAIQFWQLVGRELTLQELAGRDPR